MATPRIASGTVIARRYVVESTAGSGGMGVVYRATDLHSDGPVALKVLQRGAAPGHELERFGREVLALIELRHPAIVGYVGHGATDDGSPFLAMEWLEGEDLSRRLRRRRLDVEEAVSLAGRIGEALAAAHRHGLIHRDIKPHNIFLRDGLVGRATLLDFGIARRVREHGVLTATGALLGTPEYMAPEQARGQGDVGPAADIFSLGCVLFEALTGRSPFVGEHMTAVLAKILFDEPSRLGDVRPDLPLELADLVDRMLAKDHHERLADGTALVHALAGLPPVRSLTARTTGGRTHGVTLDRGDLGDDEQRFVSVVVATEATLLGERTTLDPRVPHSGKWSALALHSFGAQVEELADGSIVATVLPSPGLTPSDQAVLAARCALLVRERLPDRIVAVATGRRVLADPLPRGEAIDRAVALLRVVAPTDVRCDALSARLLGARFDISRVDEQVSLIHAEKLTFDESQPLLGRPTPCLGREQELGALEATLAACIDESIARVTVVRGGPGMGKSRLRHEFLRRTRTRGDNLLVLQGRADVMQAGAAHAVLRDALRAHCDVQPGDDLETQQQKIRACVGCALLPDSSSRPFGPEDAGRVCEFLGELCGVPFPDDKSPSLRAARRDPKLMHEQQTAAFISFVGGQARARAVLLVLDDLQWGDAPSIKLIDQTLRALTELPVMVLAFARPEVDELVRGLWRERGVQELRLSGLGRRASERLVHHVLGAAADPALVARIVDQAAGNALYLEELIRSAAEGTLDTLPDTVLAMLHARLQALDPAARRLLRAASCYGETFWRGGVLAILHSESSTQEPDAWLPLLVEQELLVKRPHSRLPDEVEYSFRHALVREAAYSLLADEDRARAHHRAADYLERAGEADPRVLAEHWHRADEPSRAAPYDLEAAEQAYAAGDHAGTLRHAERGLAGNPSGELRGGLLMTAAWVHAWRLDPRAAPMCEEAVLLARPGGVWWCSAMTYLLNATLFGDQVERFASLSDRYLATTPEPAAEPIYASGAANLVSLHGMRGARGPAAAAATRVRDIAARHPDDRATQGWLGVAVAEYLRAGEPDPQQQQDGLRAAHEHFSAAQDRRNAFFSGCMYGQGQVESGLVAEGEATLRDNLALALGLGDGFFINMARIHLAAALAQRTDPAPLVEAAEIAAALTTGEGVGAGYRAWAHGILAQARLQQGELADAELHVGVARNAPSTNALRLRLAATTYLQVLLARDAVAEALALAESELRWLADAGGAGYAELPLRLAVAEVLHAAGEHDRARAQLGVVLATVATRAARIVDPAWRARYVEAVPTHARAAALARAWS
ncbi:MAG: protein kinase [Myxococcales bacterium]|nr:protein kinase [Myxococcales bacterium]